MGICAEELAEYVIRPTLEYLGAWSADSEMLLLGTAAAQSGMGYHLCKTSSGRGIYAINSECHRRVWDEYLAYRPDVASRVRGLASQHEFLVHPDFELSTNLAYATAIAWAIYRWRGAKLPSGGNPRQLERLWKRFFPHPRPGNRNQFLSAWPARQSGLRAA